MYNKIYSINGCWIYFFLIYCGCICNIVAGVESFSVDMKEKELTLIGNIDPIKVVAKVKKVCPAEIISVGPAKEGNKNGINPLIFYGAASVEEDIHPNRCAIM